MPPLRSWPRPNWKWLLTLFALLSMALLLAAACGDGEGEEEGPAKTPPVEESPTATPISAETPAVTESPAFDLTEELKSLSAEVTSKPAKVSYDFSMTTDGQTAEGSMTLYWRAPDWRMDVSTEEGDITMILAGGTTYICGAQLGESQCLSFDLDAPEAAAFAASFQDLRDLVDPEGINESIADAVISDIDRSEKTIAGEKAKCFSVSGTFEGETGTVEWCFANDGILLRMSGTGDADGENDFYMEATEISREVSDSDFEAPYPVTEIPGLSMPTPGG